MLRIMTIGDVTSPRAASALAERLWQVRREYAVDLLVINAENAGVIIGPSPDTAKLLLSSGADVLTGGNHILQNTALHALLENDSRILRPANFPPEVAGSGYTIAEAKGYRVLVLNVMGRVHMDPPLDSPFAAAESILRREEGRYDIAVMDVHAEATGEKMAIAMHLDGRFAAIWGTHTHVPTADLSILPKGTGYVSDVGMCGADGGILGLDAALIVKRCMTGLPSRALPAEGDIYADAVLFIIDESTGKTVSLERHRIHC